jgi:hypothetical protein
MMWWRRKGGVQLEKDALRKISNRKISYRLHVYNDTNNLHTIHTPLMSYFCTSMEPLTRIKVASVRLALVIVTLGLALDTYLVINMFYIPRHTFDLPKVPRACPSCPKVVRPFLRPFLAFLILRTMSCPCPFDFAGAFLIWLSVID